MLGKLCVRPISAQLVKDKDHVGFMDPYVTFKLGDQYFQSVPAVSQGQYPTWNEQFTFNISANDKLKIRVMDRDIKKDDFLGKLTLKVSDIIHKPHSKSFYDLKSKFLGRTIGQLMLAFDWFPEEKPIVIPQHHGYVIPAQTTQVITSQPQVPQTISPPINLQAQGMQEHTKTHGDPMMYSQSQTQQSQGNQAQKKEVIVTKTEETKVYETNQTHPQSTKGTTFDKNAQVGSSNQNRPNY